MTPRRAALIARTLPRLGWRSLARVGLYRLGLRTGLHPVLRITPPVIPDGPLLCAPSLGRAAGEAVASPVWADRPWAFGQPVAPPSVDPPDWHASLLGGPPVAGPSRPWPQVRAFDPAVGDIKLVWESSRFDWVLSFAQQARHGDATAAPRLERWLRDWIARNPAYAGPNWMCGQEAGIRVARLALAHRLLHGPQAAPSPALSAVLRTHLRRIAPTVGYALGQNNNHATSEAMALFVGGLLLRRSAAADAEAIAWCDQGRRLIAQTIRALIFDDGGFAQYSFIYHRLMLDALALTELFRRDDGAAPLPADVIARAGAATLWLADLTDPVTGDVPNIGANDGAWLLPLGSGHSRDMRPSIDLAASLFLGGRYHRGCPGADSLLAWLDLPEPGGALTRPDATHRIWPDSRLAQLDDGRMRAVLRLPGSRFRPPQADALHLDLWHDHQPVAVDAGSFSYFDDRCVSMPHGFSATQAHNTICFDDSEQMPRISRFLYGDWLALAPVAADSRSLSSHYTDRRGRSHQRRVTRRADGVLEVVDRIDGRFSAAVLRWRLAGGPWQLTPTGAARPGLSISVAADGPTGPPRLTAGLQSLVYNQATPVTVLEIGCHQPMTLTTLFDFGAP